MDTYSSGEDLLIKARKPYTITKQRERWTDEEHNRFLEALKLYGRAWQKIEEHIGTKTAVQIRSHAQKFFSKLEKEAVAKGVPVGQDLDIDIPPPRPKRKPSNPYPRKSTSQVGAKDANSSMSASACRQELDLGMEPPQEEKPNEYEKATNRKESHNKLCSEESVRPQEPHCSSLSSANNSTTNGLNNACPLREFVPLEEDSGRNQASYLENSKPSLDKSEKGKIGEDSTGGLTTNEMLSSQNYPRHVPVHILDGSLGNSSQSPTDAFQDSVFRPVGGVHGCPNMFTAPAAASANTQHQHDARRHINQGYNSYQSPFTPVSHNQDDYRPFLQMSSAMSSLIVSTLLQNPAAHAAASFAASFSPYADIEASADSPGFAQGGFPPRQISSPPSVTAIAAATVAAATAWWTASGLLPMCAPFYSAYPCLSVSAVPTMGTSHQTSSGKTDRRETTSQNPSLPDQLDQKNFDAVDAQHSASKSPAGLSSDSEESGGAKSNNGSKTTEHEKAAAPLELHDLNKLKSKKQVDRSSCGSNTPSSSDLETDALDKCEKGKEEPKEPDAGNPAAESSNCRFRSTGNMYDSWKEVSEEGRLAFQALFSREVLPQSFSPPHHQKNVGPKECVDEYTHNTGMEDRDATLLDLNKTTGVLTSSNQTVNRSTTEDKRAEDGLLTITLGDGKLKARRTGFKPYKRCTFEAKETRVASVGSQGEEKGPKRIRIEGNAST